ARRTVVGSRPVRNRGLGHDAPRRAGTARLRDPARRARHRTRVVVHDTQLPARLRSNAPLRHDGSGDGQHRDASRLARRSRGLDVTSAIEFRNVDAGYGAFRALFDVSFSVAPGEAVALVGPNGSGKTTIARVASGLIAPNGGAVLVDGED